MYGYIYRITDLKNGKLYIGQHKYDKPELDTTYHGSGKIIKQIYKKRPQDLLEEIIFIAATEDELNYFEQYFIEHLNTLHPNGYNLLKGGGRSEEQDKKISMTLAGKQTGRTPWNKGKKNVYSEETLQMMSDKKIGREPWNKGKKCPQYSGEKHWTKTRDFPKEAIKKMSESKTKYHISFEEIYNMYVVENKSIEECSDIFNCTRSVISRKLREYKIPKRPLSDEARRKMSEAHKGRKPWNTGRQLTEEHKRKNSEAHKGQKAWNKGKFKVPYEEIYNYYINDKLTPTEIAKIFNCSSKYISKFIRKYIKI